MRADLNLRNGKVFYEGAIRDASVGIAGGKIVSIRKGGLPKAEIEIDLKGKLLLPGIIDAHVHFRDPGLTWKEDFWTGSMAAAAGGVTTVCDMPNCVPPTDSLARFKEKIKIASRKSCVDFAFHAGLPRNREEGMKLRRAGAISFKVYTESQGDSSIPDLAKIGLPIAAHAEDPRVLKKFKGIKDGAEEFLRSRPKAAEIGEISRLLGLSKGAHLHVCHITAGDSVKLLRGRKSVTCEVTPHHLLLSSKNLQHLGPIAKTLPPIRPDSDRVQLLKALRDGKVDIVVSDHAPHSKDEKKRGWEEAPPGIAGAETMLPLIFTLVKQGKLSLRRMVEAMCSKPARIFGLGNETGVLKGEIKVGGDADLVVLNQKERWKIKGDKLHGKTKFTPFEGRKVIGKVCMSLVRGNLVFEGGEIIGKRGSGRFIPRLA